MGKKTQVNVTFSEGEKRLYEWLLSKTRTTKRGRRRGISATIKQLLWAYMLMEAEGRLARRELVLKMFLETTCPYCGQRGRFWRVEEKPDKTFVVFWCERCGMPYSAKVEEGKVLSLERVMKKLGI